MTARAPRNSVSRHECGFVSKRTTPGLAAHALRRHNCQRYLKAAEAKARGRALRAGVDRTPKPCLHKIAQHQHGTYACYTLDKCRCEPCSAAVSAYERQRVRRNAYGRSDLIDTAEVREHVHELTLAGIGLKRVSKLSGVSSGSLFKLMYGKKDADGVPRPSTKIRKATAQRLLAISAAPAALAGGALVDATGSHRRVQALVTLGWSLSKIGLRLDMSSANFARTMTSPRVAARTARAVSALYDELWNVTPPNSTHREKISVSRARGHAAAHGWLPPLAWDDDTIDDPNAAPADVALITKRGRGGGVLPPVDELQFLLDNGESIATIALRFHVSEGGVTRALQRDQQEQKQRTTAA